MRIISFAAVFAAIFIAQADAQQLPDPAELRAVAGETAQRIEQYREILRDPDPNVRMAAFVQLAAVDHPVIRQLAYEEGFASSDALLRALALRYSFFDRSHFILRYRNGSRVPTTYRLTETNASTGDFAFRDNHTRRGRVQGHSVQMTLGACVAELVLDDSDMLVGELQCPDEALDIEIDLRGN